MDTSSVYSVALMSQKKLDSLKKLKEDYYVND